MFEKLFNRVTDIYFFISSLPSLFKIHPSEAFILLTVTWMTFRGIKYESVTLFGF